PRLSSEVFTLSLHDALPISVARLRRRTVLRWPFIAAFRKISTWILPDSVRRVLALGLRARSWPVGSSIHIGIVLPWRLFMVNDLMPCSWNHSGVLPKKIPQYPRPYSGCIRRALPPVSLGELRRAIRTASRAIRRACPGR